SLSPRSMILNWPQAAQKCNRANPPERSPCDPKHANSPESTPSALSRDPHPLSSSRGSKEHSSLQVEFFSSILPAQSHAPLDKSADRTERHSSPNSPQPPVSTHCSRAAELRVDSKHMCTRQIRSQARAQGAP